MAPGGKSLSAADNQKLRDIVREFVARHESQEDAAAAMGIGQGTLSDFLGGKRGAGPKVIKGIVKHDPRAAAVLFGPVAHHGKIDPLSGAVSALIEDGAGTEAEVAAAAVEAEEETEGRKLTLLGWVEVIRPILRRNRAAQAQLALPAPELSGLSTIDLAHRFKDTPGIDHGLLAAFCAAVARDESLSAKTREAATKALEGGPHAHMRALDAARGVLREQKQPKRSITPVKRKA